MADSTFTNKLEDFLDKNTPGGYIITNVNISNDDLTERINSVLSTKGYLDHTSTLPYNQITDKPIFSDVAISGNYEDLTNKPDNQTISITRNITEGTKIATISINDVDTDLYAPIEESFNGGTMDYLQLINRPSITNRDTFAQVAFSGLYSDLSETPNLRSEFYLIDNHLDLEEVELDNFQFPDETKITYHGTILEEQEEYEKWAAVIDILRNQALPYNKTIIATNNSQNFMNVLYHAIIKNEDHPDYNIETFNILYTFPPTDLENERIYSDIRLYYVSHDFFEKTITIQYTKLFTQHDLIHFKVADLLDAVLNIIEDNHDGIMTLTSPDGSRFKLKVDNNGTIFTEKITISGEGG